MTSPPGCDEGRLHRWWRRRRPRCGRSDRRSFPHQHRVERDRLTLKFTSPSSTRPTYFTIYLYFINATDLLYDVPQLYQRSQLITLRFTSNLSTQPTYFTLYLFFINATNLRYNLPLLYQRNWLTLQCTHIDSPLLHSCNRINLSTRPTYFTIHFYFINATDLLYDLLLLYQHGRLTLRFTTTWSTQPTQPTIYFYFINVTDLLYNLPWLLSTRPSYFTTYLYFINRTDLL